MALAILALVTACAPRPIHAGPDVVNGPMAEDSAGWNCHTMGNRLCGPQAAMRTFCHSLGFEPVVTIDGDDGEVTGRCK